MDRRNFLIKSTSFLVGSLFGLNGFSQAYGKSEKRKIFRPQIALIIDDIGYVQQEKEEMEVLFTLLAERYEQGSVMITSNLPFSKWEKIFKDPMMTAAAVDRIVHHSIILELNIDSYRMDTAKKRKLKEVD